MKNRKRFFFLPVLVLLSLALPAGCGSPDSDLNDTGEVIDAYDFGGALARNKKLLDIAVGHDQEAIYIYYEDYDSEELRLLDKVELPAHELHDTDWEIEWVDTDDITGDYNGDLGVTLRHADYSVSYIVWTWEKDKGYVYQPDESRFYDPGVTDEPDEYHAAVEDSRTSDTYDPYDYSSYEGLWRCVRNDQYYYYLQFDADGNWQLWLNGDVIDEGHLWYSEEQGYAIYIGSTLGRFMDGSGIGLDGDRLCISTNGDLDFCFDYLDGRGGQWQGAAGSNWADEYRRDFEQYHRDISEFEGTWYYNNIFWASCYIVIDGNGNWSFYEYFEGSEATENDRGTISCSPDETSVYYADSAMDEDVSYRVLELEENLIIWNDKYEFYRID